MYIHIYIIDISSYIKCDKMVWDKVLEDLRGFVREKWIIEW